MINYQPFIDALRLGPLARLAENLPQQIASGLCTLRHGDLAGWYAALANLPDIQPSQRQCAGPVQFGLAEDLTPENHAQLLQALQQLIPWRKGPYDLFGIDLTTEWQSDWKWDRLAPHISPLHNRRVLDVGCGNGYHCWRMYGEGAQQVIGIDPSPRFVVQFYMLKKYWPEAPVEVLPLPLEALPEKLEAFDTCFSMGVLYHRRSPMDHLRELKDTLRPGGELILETLVIEGADGQVLVPPGRYASMGNVWFIPSVPSLVSWLQKSGFSNVRCVDINKTSLAEQQATDWMKFHSLQDFLDPQDHSKTIEGHPAPRRAIFVAEKPGG